MTSFFFWPWLEPPRRRMRTRDFYEKSSGQNGSTFHAEFSRESANGSPSTFSRAFLAECFVAAAEVAVKKGYTSRDDFWEEVRSIITQHQPDCRALSQADLRTNSGWVLLMNSHLAIVMR